MGTAPSFFPVLSRHALPMHVPTVRKAVVGPPSLRYVLVSSQRCLICHIGMERASLCNELIVPSFLLPRGRAASHYAGVNEAPSPFI
jgi:hypothetical protein